MCRAVVVQLQDMMRAIMSMMAGWMEVRKTKRRWNEVHPEQSQMEGGRSGRRKRRSRGRDMRNDDNSQKTQRKRMCG